LAADRATAYASNHFLTLFPVERRVDRRLLASHPRLDRVSSRRGRQATRSAVERGRRRGGPRGRKL